MRSHPFALAIITAVAALTTLACDSKCKDFAEKAKQACLKSETQTFLVDGKPAGQLRTNEQAEKVCEEGGERWVAWCKAAPDDVFRCASENYAGTHAEWKADNKCQKLLGDHYEKTKPKK